MSLKEKYGICVFFETGTLEGHTAEWASGHFDLVETIEKDEFWFIKTSERLSHIKNIHFGNFDSAELMETMERGPMAWRNTLFWLVAHTNEYCPVLREIGVINRCEVPGVILVDDARLFGDLPAWPKKEEVVWALINGGKRTVREVDDVLVAEPCP